MLEKLPAALGRALHGQRAGLENIAFNLLDLGAGTGSITISSPAFRDQENMPAVYTADGPGISPPLAWSNISTSANGLVLIVEDADAPTPQPLVHLIVVDLLPKDGVLPEGAIRHGGGNDLHVRTGKNSYLQAAWLPPDPPTGHGVHRYAFQLFALDSTPIFADAPGRDEVLAALRKTAIASGCLIGTYERPAR
jgi:Raf kinase inhibitor-like YbhB/YbcL family protein